MPPALRLASNVLFAGSTPSLTRYFEEQPERQLAEISLFD
jgi:hypothetical protein